MKDKPEFTIKLHPKLAAFITELNSVGLYGDTFEDTLIRLIERSAAQLWEKWEGTPEPKGKVGFEKPKEKS